MQLSIKKLFRVCTHLAFQSCKIIHSVHQSSSLNTLLKSQNDPVTQADFKVQSLITKGLKLHWPQLKIVGEENKQYEGNIDYDFSKLEQQIFNQSHFNQNTNQKGNDKIDLSKIVVWIDPLDGTLSYTNGYLDQVTTLIGISYGGIAKYGVIGSYYRKKYLNQKVQYELNPRVYIGDSQKKIAYKIDQNFNIERIKPRKHHPQKRLCVSRSHMTPQQFKRMENISPNILRMGGIGKKAIQIIEDRADTFVYLGRGIGSWDVCAPEAIIKSIDGNLTKANGENQDYKRAQRHLIEGGVVLTIDDSLHKQVINKLQQ